MMRCFRHAVCGAGHAARYAAQGLVVHHVGDIAPMALDPADFPAVAEAPPAGWEDAARAACAALAAFRRPRFYVALDALPRNGQGKLVRRHVVTVVNTRWQLTDGPRPSVQEI